MQHIIDQVQEKYNIEVSTTNNFRGGVVVGSSAGKCFLKKVPFSSDRIIFIHRAKEHLYGQGFTQLDRFLCTNDEKPYFEVDGENYTLSHMVDGRECNFDSKPDLNTAVRQLAYMHKASKGFKQETHDFAKSDLGKLPQNLKKRLQDISKMKKKALKAKGKFDYLFLDWYDYFYKLGESALEQLSLSKYHEIVEDSKIQGFFCHRDYTHSNILFNGQKTYIINFDSCCLELKMYDLMNLIRRKMRKCNWNIEEAKNVVQAYNAIETISPDEFDILTIMLKFPQKFWRVANRYYNSRHGWAEKVYISKLNEVIGEVEVHKSFMANIQKMNPLQWN